MRIATVLTAAALGLTACGTTAAPPAGPDHSASAPNENDCAVIAAVAKEHYRFNDRDRLPPPLWLDGEGSDWAPRCDWSHYGLSFPRTFSPEDRPQPQRVQWVSFKRPRYDDNGALIESGILHGPLAGMGVECRVRSGIAGWTVTECKGTWIS